MLYQFRRDFYYKLEDFILNNNRQNVLFLLGPRKCGKTVALRQLESNIPSKTMRYINFKSISRTEKLDYISDVLDSIRDDEDVCYLLDEVTYMLLPPEEINAIAGEFSKYINHRTKIILSGSQLIAVDSWGRRAFCNNALYLSVDFLSYKEWVSWRDISEINKDTFMKFCLDTFNFYDSFTTIEEYLKGCIDETIQSNSKCSEFYQELECDSVDSQFLTDLTYLLLSKLHNNTSYKNLSVGNNFTDRLIFIYKTHYKNCFNSIQDLETKINSSIISAYNNVMCTDINKIRQSLLFLLKIGFITGTNVTDDISKRSDVISFLKGKDSRIEKINDISDKFNFTINYPMFYCEILKEIFGTDIDTVDGSTLGSVTEMYLRGLLSDNAIELRVNNDKEIDYIDVRNSVVIEFTTSNKKLSDVNLSLMDDYYLKILLTKDKCGKVEGGIVRIPFAEFIYNLANGMCIKDIYKNYKDKSCTPKLDELLSNV